MKDFRLVQPSRVYLDGCTGFIVGTMAGPVAWSVIAVFIALVDALTPPFPLDLASRWIFWLGGFLGAGVGTIVGSASRKQSDSGDGTEMGDAAAVVTGAFLGVVVVLLTIPAWRPPCHSYGFIRGNSVAPLMICLPIGALLGGLAGRWCGRMFIFPDLPEVDLSPFYPPKDEGAGRRSADENPGQVFHRCTGERDA